jgi:nickel-type superoxide dismutase maturation protease
MLPVLSDSDEVVVSPTRGAGVGDIVVARHPYRTHCRLIKRVVDIDCEGRLTLLGDNPQESTDSRTLGPFPADRIIGTVIGCLDASD